ncbi:4-hydroxy-tetrahydrodipicolinate reductase [Azotosporobacter soli]|uniref:4-hydroxy-tetrahydrodipicolinate reductase n=1 Tax=Azotosporobacter soli TaxID=3055040 RepID=UPI0031FEAFAF
MIKVVVCGALGKMGREVVKAVQQADGLVLAGAVDLNGKGQDIGECAGLGSIGITVDRELETTLKRNAADVVVDFTVPQSVMNNIRTATAHKVYPVVGTTGLSENDLKEIDDLCRAQGIAALIAPNFAIGAILLMQLAEQAVRFFPQVEIIELHHDQKLDAPSGTALHTAEKLAAIRGKLAQGHPDEEEKISGARGADYEGIRLHSVRLPGYVAHEEVIFGGLGQTLTIRHDSISRESFMPGVVLACKSIMQFTGLVHGLDKIMAIRGE